MAAFADLLDLRTAVVEQVGRPDIADVFPRLVKLAEAHMSRNLRTRAQVTSTTLTFVSGVASVPADFAEAIGLYDANGYEYVQQPLQQVKTRAWYYSMNASQFLVNGFEGDLTLEYYATIPTISGSMTDTNWLLARYPGVYLDGVAYEASKHVRDAEMGKAMRQLYQMELDDAAADDFGARYSRARVRVAGMTP